ncbi:hypothetical protein PV10_02582 [Exophiala mesophila]|uniref:FAD-binding PCMH-type domain-containing protein n=1 Tax=Exophiala mesophila TaxID=212818 RepID=A0A0D2A778_EXOME|nr:uncharacterized protein PV10_02582 [Exophiala mesophila]KIV94858.1 hypothetical protein PV10_02582 [Exophiala mesophila]
MVHRNGTQESDQGKSNYPTIFQTMSNDNFIRDLPIVWKATSAKSTYEQARIGRVFNYRRPDRYPVAVVEAETIEHVIQAVKLAKKHNYRVSVRSGGHSWAVWSVRDDAVLVDLGKMKHMSLDAKNKTVAVSPSTTGKMLNSYLLKEGLMFPGGHCPDVGLGGFLLQGGMGWNCKNWGWACEHILAIDVVTAEGELIRADSESHRDLFWAARGAGPGFPGVVVRFHLKVRESYKSMYSSTFTYPIEKYREVLQWLIQDGAEYDPDTEIVAIAAVPPEIGFRCVVALFVVFKHTELEAKKALEPANKSRPEGFVVEAPSVPTSLADQYLNQAAANPERHRYCVQNAYISNDADVVSILEASFTTIPNSKSFTIWYAMNPCSRRPLRDDMAVSMQTDHYMATYALWEDPDDDDAMQKWVKDIMGGVVGSSQVEGAYLGDADFQERQAKFWSTQNALKLAEVRKKNDPAGRICGYLDRGDVSGLNGLSNEEHFC